MCKEDVRIKRRTDVNAARFTANNAPLVRLFPANPLRVAVVLSYEAGAAAAVTGYALLRAGDKTTDPVILTVGPGCMSDLRTIEQVGQLVTREIWGKGDDPAAPSINCVEVFFTKDLDDK